jgi:hypothetical protein
MTSGEPIEHGQPASAGKSAGEWIHSIEDEIVHFEHGIEDIAKQPAPVLFLKVIAFDLPYIIMLSAAIFGIGYVSLTGQPATFYWELLAPLFGVICVWAGWRHVEEGLHKRLIVTQALHWAAVLVAMLVLYSPEVRGVENNNAAGISMMTVLALATFLAGVHALSWQVCAVGVILGIAIPAIAWITISAPFLVVVVFGLIFIAFVVASLWWTMHREKTKVNAV